MKRFIGEKVLMKGHNDEKTQWFKYMMKEAFKQEVRSGRKMSQQSRSM